MYSRFLVDVVVRQTAVLLAELATRSEERSLLAELQTLLLLHLDNELGQRGMSQRARATALGLTEEAYRTELLHAQVSVTEPEHSLSDAICRYVMRKQLVKREAILQHFAKDGEARTASSIERLVGAGMIFRTRTPDTEVLRASSPDEQQRVSALDAEAGLDQLVWAVIYREGPLHFAELLECLNIGETKLKAALERLCKTHRVTRKHGLGIEVQYHSQELVVPLDAKTGVEATVLDHLQAVVSALTRRMQLETARLSDVDGVSTYTLDVWDSHPLWADARGLLREFRERVTNLRKRIEAYNAASNAPRALQPVRVYFGQQAGAR